MDKGENIWVSLPERQAIVVVTKSGKVIEVFRNPVNLPSVVYGQGLRNTGEQSVGNNHILESPTVPFLMGKVFCTAQDDTGRRIIPLDAKARSAAANPKMVQFLWPKIFCIDQELKIPGLRLPID